MIESDRVQEFLVRQRKTSGLTQAELAELCGVSVRTIRNLEAGSIANPRRDTLTLLFKGLADSARISNFRSAVEASGILSSPSSAGDDRTSRAIRSAPSTWSGPRPDPGPIVGRGADLQSIIESIQKNHLLVLVGAGGVGKSKVALAAADRAFEKFRDGVIVVDLGAVPGEKDADAFRAIRDLTLQSLAPGRMHGPGDGARPRGPNMLLVLDNAEHVMSSTAAAVRQILDQLPDVHVMITSRRRLYLPSAQILEIRPLGLVAGESGGYPPASDLLMRLAKSACPTLDLSDKHSEVDLLCHRLGGLPFAIELASRRLSSLSLRTLINGGPSGRLLGEARTNKLPHQRSLFESVKWSYELLSAEQKNMLHSLHVFTGSFELEDVLRIHASDSDSITGLLADLADASLIDLARDGQYRYALAPFVRDFVQAKSMRRQSWPQPLLVSGRQETRSSVPSLLAGPDYRGSNRLQLAVAHLSPGAL